MYTHHTHTKYIHKEYVHYIYCIYLLLMNNAHHTMYTPYAAGTHTYPTPCIFFIVYAHHTYSTSISHSISLPQSVSITHTVYTCHKQYIRSIQRICLIYCYSQNTAIIHSVYPPHSEYTLQRSIYSVYSTYAYTYRAHVLFITHVVYTHHAQCMPILHISTERI